MKLVKHFVFAVLLASVLAVSAPAGEIDMPGWAGPSPTPAPIRAKSTSDEQKDDLNDPIVTTETVTVATSDYLFFEALAALLSVY